MTAAWYWGRRLRRSCTVFLGLLVLSGCAPAKKRGHRRYCHGRDTFSYGSSFSSGEIDEMQSDTEGFLEEQKLTKLHEMNRLLVRGWYYAPELL